MKLLGIGSELQCDGHKLKVTAIDRKGVCCRIMGSKRIVPVSREHIEAAVERSNENATD